VKPRQYVSPGIGTGFDPSRIPDHAGAIIRIIDRAAPDQSDKVDGADARVIAEVPICMLMAVGHVFRLTFR
jgi:hypothetical protein